MERLQKALLWLAADPNASDRWVRFDATSKRFEVAFEYTWKAFKIALEYQGVEAYGPRDAIALSGKFGWIDNPVLWAGFLEARNAGVHDYFALSEDEYAEIAGQFLAAARRSLQVLP